MDADDCSATVLGLKKDSWARQKLKLAAATCDTIRTLLKIYARSCQRKLYRGRKSFRSTEEAVPRMGGGGAGGVTSHTNHISFFSSLPLLIMPMSLSQMNLPLTFLLLSLPARFGRLGWLGRLGWFGRRHRGKINPVILKRANPQKSNFSILIFLLMAF